MRLSRPILPRPGSLVTIWSLYGGDTPVLSDLMGIRFDFIGAAREIRTPDPIITNDVLYQLSYCGPVDQRCAGGAF